MSPTGKAVATRLSQLVDIPQDVGWQPYERDCNAIACCIAWRNHHPAYATNGTPRSGSKRSTARNRPNTPSCTRSANSTSRPAYPRATRITIGKHRATN